LLVSGRIVLSYPQNLPKMNPMFVPSLLFYYGVFLIVCGIASVTLIGWKAKTALVSGGISGVIAITIGHFISVGSAAAQVAGLLVCLGLFGVFCWRSAKTLFTLFELIPERHPDLKGKAIAFLIISLMAVVSIVVLLLQLSSIATDRTSAT
jgi:hypothetical protein